MSTDKNTAIIAVTAIGKALAASIKEALAADCYVPAKLQSEGFAALQPDFATGMRLLFQQYDALVCIMATGIAVRTLAPVISDKLYDPAVVVMDEKALHAISLLSGHVGGANDLARKLAELTGAVPVITTATDVQQVAALDMIVPSIPGWIPDFRENCKRINGLLAAGKTVCLYEEVPVEIDRRGFTTVTNPHELPEQAEALVWVTYRYRLPELNVHTVKLVPRTRVLGVGCRKQTEPEQMRQAFTAFCIRHDTDPQSFAVMASIDIKKDEPAIKQLAEQWNCPFITYTADQLREVEGKYPVSEFVRQTVKVGSVALSAADLASGGRVLTPRFAVNGITMAMGERTKLSDGVKA
ncbi:cobalt-precorrin 5A hydrolase [Paenibacillus dendritiformis]|uniref:cobalt-precorrin 5A hydrolase n=1 Tax=Paenibacillus dendritiformis TaxID=130049 RepID=UPI00248ADFEF|nr:cobalt-precorrin 5A hydrolase [Paenibacillus dendritiformis]WGU95037.1 cobalt-precorrin 5A hydrolase [Paenibacillus dendritiformis]